jgi:F-type H+-transporting ATPase subunit alpha
MDTEYNQLLKKTGEYGVVYQVSHPIVFIEGLPMVRSHEVIVFENGQKGEIFTIDRGKVEARVFSHEPIKVGTKVTRTDKTLSIAVGKELLGQAINPLGEPLDPSTKFTPPKEYRDLDTNPVGISGRKKITVQLTTGISLVDLLLPLGRGQRELIIGDRKTGKTSFLMTTIKKQAYEGVICIYAAIAKKKSDIKKMQEFFVQEKIMDKIIIVATSSYDSPTLIYQTPYTAMAIAEYFRDQGINTLLILDDLSTHAKFYRELSLLARRFPGRDSYPGDIFFVHSKLLERAGNFKHPTAGEVSITCLPVIEIIEGDFTGYISTNVMGITDGHIYLDSNIYYQGMRPAVNIPLSVTRVGRQTLSKLSRDINKNLTAFLTSYDKLQNLSHFGQELTDEVKKSLRLGQLIYSFFNQPYQMVVPKIVQMIILSMILENIIENKEILKKIQTGLIAAFYDRGKQKLLYDIVNTKDLKIFNENVLANKDKLFALAEVK